MQRVLFSIILIVIGFGLNAQNQVSQNFTIANGLPSNRVYHSLVDSKGFVWFSTDKGVSRYDGYSFKNYTTRDGLTDNEVFFMFEDSKHRIWFMTFSGKLSFYKQGIFYNPNTAPFLKQATTEGMFSRAYEDKWGNVLFITTASGFFILKDTTFKHYLPKSGFYSPYVLDGELYLIANGDEASKLLKIKKDNGYKLLDTTYNKGLLFYNWFKNDSLYSISKNNADVNTWKIHAQHKKSFSGSTVPLKTEEDISPYYIKEINNQVYIGTDKGLYTIGTDRKVLTLVGLRNQQISSIVLDFEGSMWVTTLQGGVFMQPKINLRRYKNISGNINKVVTNPYTKDIWAGNPRQLIKISNSIKRQFTLPKTSTFNEKITSFYFTSKNKFLVGSDMSLAYFNGKRFSALKDGFSGVKNLTYDIYNQRLMGAFASSVATVEISNERLYNPNRIIVGRSTAVLAIDKNTLWVGSNSGLYEYNLTAGLKKKILNQRINHILKDSAGNIWCSSDVVGLYLFANNKFTHFTEKDGLHTNNINRLIIDSKQNIWLASPIGIIKASYKNERLRVKNYILNNILGKEQVNDVAIKKDTILVASTSGLYFFKEKEFKQEIIKPPLVINNIIIEGRAQEVSSYYKLNHEQNNIQVNYTAISYTSQNLNYRYVLSSMGKEWQYTTSRSVNLVDLNPGKYILTIQAIKDGTIFSEPQQIKFTIVPPFYKAWWFYILVALAIALLITIVIRYRIQSIRKRAYISQVIAESKQKALRAQMNPHFLFNSLISIQSFFLNKRNTEGQEYTSKFSKLIRNILDNSDKEFITIEDEVATLKNYTDLENIRLKTPFEFTVSISNEIDPNNTYIPTMLLQPIIENAIWHGINYLKNKQGKINVTFTKEGEGLKITIEDNGVGFAKSAEINKARNHVSKGTQLIKERLEAINIKRKTNIHYTAKDKPQGGAIVTLNIPIDK